ncbi:MAG: T9SS type A sorting domain-containing protein [Chitinophagales bacterium]|nr:T9SS type A sorting domain-containing protein [Chitinophagales bacterium]
MNRLLLLLLLVESGIAYAQFENIKIDDSGGPEEPSICINPKNTNNIVAGANINYVYQSLDGGLTWEKDALESPYGVWGDPCVFADTGGVFYFIHLSNPPNGNWIDRIVCQRSVNQGTSWSGGSYTGLNSNKAQDKAWATVDRTTNTIYVTWTQFDEYGSANPNDSSVILFSKSTDHASTWSTPVRISNIAGDCLDGDNTAEGAVPAIGANGEIYVCWSNRDTLYFDRSLDGGTTWLDDDIVVADQPGGWDYFIPGMLRCNGLPVTETDLSNGPYHGTIYVNWTDQRNGTDNTDVWLSKSGDGGSTWSAPFKVNDDAFAKHQFLTWMDIDQSTGFIYVIFYDRRNYVDQSTDVYLAYSTDGGTTFTNQKISEQPFQLTTDVFFGDYTNISVCDGKIAPIWTRQDGISTSVWTAMVDIATLAETTTAPEASHFTLYQNYPNPFSGQTTLEVNITRPGIYSLTLYDLFGKKVAEIITNDFLRLGWHRFTIDAKKLNLSSNTYYYTLQKGNEIQSKKLLVVY